jgi:hypothetical protein
MSTLKPWRDELFCRKGNYPKVKIAVLERNIETGESGVKAP